MPNEILLLCSVVFLYAGVLIFYKLFDMQGLYAWTVIATIAANIEVLILVDAFGMEQTLGNVMFASTFLVTDIISEIGGKKQANHVVKISIATSAAFILITQMWLLFTPSVNDTAMPAMKAIFSSTPRMMISGLVVFAVVQYFDVWFYHKLWNWTEKLSKDKRKFLWVRNNGSTLVSQLLNTVLFTLAAFIGSYEIKTLLSIMLASYVIFIFTSLIDTPAIYLARRMSEKKCKP